MMTEKLSNLFCILFIERRFGDYAHGFVTAKRAFSSRGLFYIYFFLDLRTLCTRPFLLDVCVIAVRFILGLLGKKFVGRSKRATLQGFHHSFYHVQIHSQLTLYYKRLLKKYQDWHFLLQHSFGGSKRNFASMVCIILYLL